MSRLPTKPRECRTKEPVCPVCGGLQCLCRPRFFPGQLLTEEDLNALDHYIVEKNKLHTRYLHGWGVACGLQVVCHECKGWVTVQEGYAVDPCGNDIIVCENHEFNVIEAINKCRRQWRKRGDCEPWSPPPGKDCKDVEQTWCLALRYKEWEARPYNPSPRQRCSCGCSGTASDGCGCGCHHPITPAHSTIESPVSHGSCEPTRVCESYCLEVFPLEQKKRDSDLQGSSSRFLAELRCCLELVQDALSSPPDVSDMTPAQAHTACCEYREEILEILASADLTRCHLLESLSAVSCPPPPGPDASVEVIANYRNAIQQEIQRMQVLVVLAYLDCVCLSFLPPCPEDTYDDLVPLASLTVKGDRVLRICHYECRKQLVTFPSLGYWLSIFGLGDLISAALERICCRDFKIADFGKASNSQFKLRLGSPVDLFSGFSDLFSLAAGGSKILTMTQPASAQELQSKRFIGQDVESVTGELEERQVEFTHQKLDTMPRLVADMAREATRERLPADRPIVVYSRGNQVVALDFQDQSAHLQKQVAAVQERQVELDKVKTDITRLKKDITRLSKRLDDVD